jgi:hypothetical protein
MEDVLLEFPFQYDTLTGKVEHTDLTDVDRAVAGFFQGVIGSLTVTDDERAENQEFARFSRRDRKAKLYAGDFDDPQTFLRKLASHVGGDIKSQRNELLPTCYVSRIPSLAFADGSDYVDIPQCAELTNEQGESYAVLNKSFVKLNYVVTGVAWSKPTLMRLMLGLMMWIRHTKQGRQHTFKAKTTLAGAPVEVAVSILSKKDALGQAVEIPHDESRVVAMSLDFEVVAEVYEAEELVRQQGRGELVQGAYIE